METHFIPIPDPFPETKPATEFIGGRLVRKMSPRAKHGSVQTAIAASLHIWAHEHGTGWVATEWDYDLTPPGEGPNRLVPDVAYLSYARMSYEDEEAAQIPKIAPDVAFEVLSPGQRMADLAEKVRIYRATGCALVVIIDPREEYAVLHDASGTRRLERDQTFAHPALPDFSLPLASFFDRPKPKPKPLS